MDAFAAMRLAIGTTVLLMAAASDVRTRKVRDRLWIVLGTVGLALLMVELLVTSAAADRFALLGCGALLFYAIFFGQPLFDEDGFHARPVRLAIFLAALLLILVSAMWATQAGGSDLAAYASLLMMPVLVLAYQGFYQVGLIHGGADTKALIALTLLVPSTPDASPFPLLSVPVILPFSLLTLINAAILFLLIPVAYLLLNAARRDLAFPMALFGLRADLDRLPEHAWLMEKIGAKGEHLLVLFPRRGVNRAEEVEKLRASGARRVWVQSQVPFLVPLLAGFLLAFFMGNLLMAFLAAVLPRASATMLLRRP